MRFFFRADLRQQIVGLDIAGRRRVALCDVQSFGRLALREFYPGLSEAERDEREEFAVEALYFQHAVDPLARSLAPGGRLIAIHSYGHDPGLEVIQKVWPGENPFITDRHALLRATKAELGSAGRELNFGAYADGRALFRYDMHTLPSEISETIGTSTLFAAWNAAVYVAQVEDQRLSEAISSGAYLEATREVLRIHGGLWFWDESYVISRKRGLG